MASGSGGKSSRYKCLVLNLESDGFQFESSVVKKKEEFDGHLSPSHLMRYPVLSSCDQDSWLLSRLSPNSGCKEDTNRQAATEDQAKAETDNDSGMDSLQEDQADNSKVTTAGDDDKECLIQSDEMQEVRLNMRARNCTNCKVSRPKIPPRLCKVTKV